MTTPQYTIEQGRLVIVSRPLHTKLWLVVCVVLLIAVLFGVLGWFVYREVHRQADGVVLVSRAEHEKWLEMERTLNQTLKNTAQTYETITSAEQLSFLFDKVFNDVQLSPEKKAAYLQAVSHWASYYSIPPLLILSIIWRESFFEESTVSKANAKGPMQVIYKYHAEKLARIGKREADLHEIDTGVRVGVEILREYFDKHNRNIFKALFAYVGGEHKTYAQDILIRYFNARIFLEEQQN